MTTTKASVAQKRAMALELRAYGDRKWEQGKKSRSSEAHKEAAELEEQADNEERQERFAASHASQQRVCTMCQEPIRGGAKPHYLLPGTLVISLHGTSKSDVLEETHRYCAACAPVVGDALMELGFVMAKKPAPKPYLPPGEYKVKAGPAADCSCPKQHGVSYHLLGCRYLTYEEVHPTAQLAPGNIGPVFSSPCPTCGYSDCHCEDDQ